MLYLELARRNKGLSQYDLGQAARVHQSFVSLIELGRGIPTGDQAARLARVLGVDAADLLKPVEVDRAVGAR